MTCRFFGHVPQIAFLRLKTLSGLAASLPNFWQTKHVADRRKNLSLVSSADDARECREEKRKKEERDHIYRFSDRRERERREDWHSVK